MQRLLAALDSASLRRPLFLAACGFVAGLSLPLAFGIGSAALLPFAWRSRGLLVLVLSIAAGSARACGSAPPPIVPFGSVATWKGTVRHPLPPPHHAWGRSEAFVELEDPPIEALLSSPRGGHDAQAGERFCVVGLLSPPRGGGARAPALLRASRPPRVIPQEVGPACSPRNLQRRWGEVLSDRIGDPVASGIVRSILLGDRSALGTDEVRDFRFTGTVYLLVVSGVHLMVLAGIVAWLLGRARMPRLPLRAALVLFTACYAALAGSKAPILRAAITLTAFLFAEVARRPPDTLNLLGLAAGLLLAIDPSQAEDLGFQLSFVAVLSIVLVTPLLLGRRPFPEEERPLGRRALDLARHVFAANFAAWLGTEPLLLLRFGLFTPVALVVNLVMGPLLWLVLLTSSVLLAGEGLRCAPMLATAARLSAQAMDAVVRTARGIPHGCIEVGPPHAAWVVATYAAILATVLFARRRR